MLFRLQKKVIFVRELRNWFTKKKTKMKITSMKIFKFM